MLHAWMRACEDTCRQPPNDCTAHNDVVRFLRMQIPVEVMMCPDRANTHTGPCINAYLRGEVELDDAAVHLLFSANRWERR